MTSIHSPKICFLDKTKLPEVTMMLPRQSAVRHVCHSPLEYRTTDIVWKKPPVTNCLVNKTCNLLKGRIVIFQVLKYFYTDQDSNNPEKFASRLNEGSFKSAAADYDVSGSFLLKLQPGFM